MSTEGAALSQLGVPHLRRSISVHPDHGSRPWLLTTGPSDLKPASVENLRRVVWLRHSRFRVLRALFIRG
jgi:hypothetical protein